MKRDHRNKAPHKRQIALIAAAVLGTAMVGGVALWADAGKPTNVFAVLTNIGARPLAPGGVHVDDLAADPFGYTDTVTLRAVVARVSAGDPYRLVVIDSREAKICKSTGCAKYFLPVALSAESVPRKWDEVDLRGKVVRGDRYPIFVAESVVANLGSIQ